MDPARVWCRMTAMSPDGRVQGVWIIRGVDRPDLATIDQIARCALMASRDGGRLLLDEVAVEVRELLELVALDVAANGAVEVRREAELGE
jgi:hypothetical protein